MNKHISAAILAFSIWGFFSLPLKPLDIYPAISILLFRVLFAITLLYLYLKFFKKEYLQEVRLDWKSYAPKKQKQQASLIALNGIFLAANWLSFIYTMNAISVRATSFAYLICPILTAILAIIILKEQLNHWKKISVLLCAIACIIIAYDDLSDMLAGLFVGGTYAFYLIIQKKITLKRSTPLLLFQLLIALPIILVYFFFQKDAIVIPQAYSFYSIMLLIAVLFTLIPLLLNIFALKGADSATVGFFLNINPVIAFLLSVFYWKESIAIQQVIGYIIIFIAILLFNMEYFKAQSKKSIIS